MPHVSLIIPTLNEEEAVGECIRKANGLFKAMNIDAEILVSDSSCDKTAKIAKSLGAIVIKPSKLGYGNAYLSAFSKARGKYLILMDGDMTYDPAEIPRFLKLLDQGYDFVIGTRLKGNIENGAMKSLHRYIGNPALTGLLNLLFSTEISDAHCGMRAISKDALDKISLHAGGMEIASEMVIEASKRGLKIAEVPISYHKRRGISKLSSFSDGWRHVRFMMLYRPEPFLLLPGIVAIILGTALTAAVIVQARSTEIRMHSLILGSLLLLIGYQSVLSGLYFAAFKATYRNERNESFASNLLSYHSLEKAIVLGALLLAIGVLMGGHVLWSWASSGFGSLTQVQSAMIALILSLIGVQTIFSGMFISLLLLKDPPHNEGCS